MKTKLVIKYIASATADVKTICQTVKLFLFIFVFKINGAQL